MRYKSKTHVTPQIAFVTSEVDAKALHVTIAVKMSQSSRMASFLSRLNPHGNHLQVGAVRRAADAAAASASTAAAAAASAAPATAASRAEEEMLLLRTGQADDDIIAFVLEADSRGEHRNALFPGLQEACTMYSESQLRERVAYLVLSGRLPEQSQEGMDPRDARAFEAAKRFIEAQAVDEEDAAGFSRKRRSKPAAKAAPKAAAASSRGLQPRKGTAPAGAFPRGPRRSTPSAADVGSKRPRSTSGGQDGAEGNSDEGSDDGEEELDGAEDWHAASDRSRKQRSTNPSAVRVRRHRENQRRQQQQQQQQQEGSAAASAPASAAPGAGDGGVGGRRGAKRKDGRPAQVARMWPADALLELVWVAGFRGDSSSGECSCPRSHRGCWRRTGTRRCCCQVRRRAVRPW